MPSQRLPIPSTSLPARPEAPRVGWLASVGMHLVVLLLLLLPRFFQSAEATEPSPGAGGPGPAGGGGGGTGGTGGVRESSPLQERLQFIQVAPEPAAVEEMTPDVPPPVPEPEPELVVPEPEIASPAVTRLTNLRPSPAPAVITGIGGGTGRDGTAGTGPGSGGGVGSGIGTGRGTGVGPGTGGGDGDIYPPTPNHFFIPPLPAPDRVKGFEMVARFEVDEQGRAKLLGFTQTPDRDYNRKLREALERLRWRPAVRADGTPIRHTAAIHYSF